MKAEPVCKSELVLVSSLKPHPRNYRKHGDDQLSHIAQSIKANGFYRNVVVAKDDTILAGHGAVAAAKQLGLKKVPVVRIGIKSTDRRALKILAGDNEVTKLGEVDDRALSEILREVASDLDIDGLLGTGFDQKMLANLVFVTRAEGEIQDFNAAAHWVGMPEFEAVDIPWKLVVAFESKEKREEFLRLIKATVINASSGKTASIYWPEKERNDPASLRFKESKPKKQA